MDLMVVKTVRPSAAGDEVMVVLETASGDRYLGFRVPLDEANRLARVLGMSGCRCAPIFELLLDLGHGPRRPCGARGPGCLPHGHRGHAGIPAC
jgi:hypothetical protein